MVSAPDFLVHIFGAAGADRAWTAVVPPNANAFSGGPASRELARLANWPDAAAYFCIAELTDPNGRRSIANAARIMCLIFDDVGTKGDGTKLRALLGDPTWSVETSPGNFQWGYRYGTPVERDGFALHKAVIHTAAGLGLCDDLGDAVRIGRLPAGGHAKVHKPGHPQEGQVIHPGWRVKVVEWNPGVTVELLDLALELGVQDTDVRRAWVSTSSQRFSARIGDTSDPWMVALDKLGMLLRENPKPGVVDIVCPFEHEHTTRADTGSAYLGRGKFECHHGHCQARNSMDFQAELAGRLSAEETGGLVDGRALIAGLAFGDELDPSECAMIEKAERVWGEDAVRSMDEAIERFIYVKDQELWWDRKYRVLVTDKGVATVLRRIVPWGSSGKKSAAALLMAETGLTTVGTVTFRPGGPELTEFDGRSAVNTYRPNDELVAQPPGRWLDVILRHMELLFPDADDRRVLECWMAHQVQRPGVKIPWMILILGGQGIGKDLLLQGLKNVLGTWNVSDVATEQLESAFNPWIEAQVVCVQELAAGERFTLYNKLKPMIAAPPATVSLNQKNRKVVELPNVQNWIGTTNNEGAVALAGDDRRVFVMQSPAKPQPGDYYRDLAEAVDRGAGEFLGWLLDYDLALAGWDPGKIPVTAGSAAAKARMTVEAMSGDAQVVREEMEDGLFAGRKVIGSKELHDALRRAGVPANRVGRAVKEALPSLGFRRWRDGTKIRLDGVPQRVWVRDGHELVDQLEAHQVAERVAAEIQEEKNNVGRGVFPDGSG